MPRTGPVLQRILVQDASDKVDERVGQEGASRRGSRKRSNTPTDERPREAVCLQRCAETDLVRQGLRECQTPAPDLADALYLRSRRTEAGIL
jgi:hypothetical protein